MRDMRRFTEPTLVIASHNSGKLKEIRALLAPFAVTVRSAGEFGLAEPEENGVSFEENAAIKARAVTERTDLPSLADDSGLAVPALGGAPGIYSARWAGANKDFGLAMQRVREALIEAGQEPQGVPAYFACALCLAWPDGHTETVEGRCHGALTFPPRGDKGFGYDPIFVPEGYDQSFGELDPALKQCISHRAKAFAELVERCFSAEVTP